MFPNQKSIVCEVVGADFSFFFVNENRKKFD